MATRIVTLPGDGIGPEILAPAVDLLKRFVPDVEVEEHLFGGASIDANGIALTDETPAACRAPHPVRRAPPSPPASARGPRDPSPPARVRAPSCSPPWAVPSGTRRTRASRARSRA